MLKDSETPRYAERRTHRHYLPEFKAELVAACLKPGASIAALARTHAMNANVLHRWLQEHQRSGAHQLGRHNSSIAQPVQTRPPELPAFIALALPSPAAAPERKPPQAQPPAIRIEIQRANATIIVNWPVQDAGACAQWLRECVQ